MKNSIIYLVGLALLVVSCNKEVAQNEVVTPEDMVTYTFKASIELPEDTRGSVNSKGKFQWEVGDQLAFIQSDGTINNNFSVTAVSNGNKEATISGTGVAGAHFVTAVYPRAAAVSSTTPTVQFGQGNGAPVIVANIDGVANEGAVSFIHAGAVLNLTFTSVPTGVTKLVFTPTGSIKSNYAVDIANSSVSSTGDATLASIEVPVTVSSGSVSVSLGVPAASYTGFTVTLDNNSGRHIFKKTSSASFTLVRKNYVNSEVAYVAPTKFYVTTSSSTKYWDKSNVRMIQSEADKFETWMNCDGNTDIYIFDNYNEGTNTQGYLTKGHVNGEGFYQIYWNRSSSTGGPVYKSGVIDKPFGNNDYPTDNMCIYGTFNNWDSSKAKVLTYNGNMNFVCTGLTIGSDAISGGYVQMKIRKTDANQFEAGKNSFGSNLYGQLHNGEGNAYIPLTAGTYTVYMCSTTDWYYLIMFE